MIKITLFITLLIASALCGGDNNWQYTQIDNQQIANDSNLNATWNWGADMILDKTLKNTNYSASDFTASISYVGHYSMNNVDYWKFEASWSNGNGAEIKAVFVVRCNGKDSYQLWSWNASTNYSNGNEQSSDNYSEEECSEEEYSESSQDNGNNGGVEVTIEESSDVEECSEYSEDNGNNGGVEVTIDKSSDVEECSSEYSEDNGNNGGVEVTIESSNGANSDYSESSNSECEIEVTVEVSAGQCSDYSEEVSNGNNGGVEVTVEMSSDEECSENSDKSKY